MVRESPLDHPAPESVGEAAAAALARPVADVTPIDEGLNAVYRVEIGDPTAHPRTAVLKAATLARDAEFLPEPRLLSLLGNTSVPLPDVLTAVGADESPFDAAFCLTAHCDGRRVTDVRSLPAAAHERLVREAGRHLAGIHALDVEAYTTLPSGPYGDLRVPSGDPAGELVVVDAGLHGNSTTDGHGAWADRIDTVVNRVTAGLGGETFTSGGADRFADLVPVVREAVAVATLPEGPPVAVVHGDYRPANLVFAEDGAADPLVRAVLDFGTPETGDGLLDLALAEDALVGVPLGGTDRGDRLANVLRRAYADACETDVSGRLGIRGDASDAYTAYLLLARAKRLSALDYFAQFAREVDPDAAARRWRERVEELAAVLR